MFWYQIEVDYKKCTFVLICSDHGTVRDLAEIHRKDTDSGQFEQFTVQFSWLGELIVEHERTMHPPHIGRHSGGCQCYSCQATYDKPR